jgi:LysW-gamma-L-lysine/LysW-L-ornithine aminotransferase
VNVREIEDRYSSGVYFKRDITVVKGLGAYLWDDAGRRYVDCVGGQGSANVGHCNPYVIEAIAKQSQCLLSCTELFYNDRRAELLSKIASLTPPGMDRTFLCNSGTEAVEGAIKFARIATGRQEIIATMRGFHGRTMGALSATWEKKYRDLVEPLVPGFKHVPYNNLEALSATVTEHTAAVIVEVVQGEGGVRPASQEYLQGTERICRDRGALLIVDEVQTGFGRTGKMFAVEHHGIRPDMLCLAKSMAGGLAMGALVIGPRVGQLPKGSHSSTFGGNPLACAASLASLRYMEDHALPDRARETGEYLLGKLRDLNSQAIREVRGLGLMVGIEVKDKASPYLRTLMDRGVLALAAGPSVIRLLPPLVIAREDIDFVVDQLTEALRS